MAITEILPGVEATIRIDGTPLEEHVGAELENKHNLTIHYVEAVSDVNFTIDVVLKKGTRGAYQGLQFEFKVDGMTTDGVVLQTIHHIQLLN